MKEIIDFIVKYWREIASLVVLLISVLIQLVKKKPVLNKLDEIKEDVLEILPILINKVEEPGNGQRKKNAVLQLVKQYMKKRWCLKDCPEWLELWVDDSIENILSTPTKKEDM